MRKERPIIIPRPEMVRAILGDRKTQHRWPIKPQPELDLSRGWWWKGKCYGIVASLYGNKFPVAKLIQDMKTACPYWIGNVLWVREKFKVANCVHLAYGPRGSAIIYEDGSCIPIPEEKLEWYYQHFDALKWQSPIFMPKWASRIKLEVIKVRVERIQDISFEDAQAEGAWRSRRSDLVSIEPPEFRNLWDSIWAKKGFGWDQNPWVWAIEFRRIENEMDKR